MTAAILATAIAAVSACAGADLQERSVPALIADLKAAEPEARGRAACELRERGDDASEAAPALVAVLSDASPIETTICGRRWWQGRDSNLTSPGELAASALVSLGSSTVPLILPVMKSPSWAARRNAAWAAGALRDERAFAGLLELLRDQEPLVREQAAWALGAIRDERALDPLLGALKDPHAGVRRQAAWAIGVIGK